MKPLFLNMTHGFSKKLVFNRMNSLFLDDKVVFPIYRMNGVGSNLNYIIDSNLDLDRRFPSGYDPRKFLFGDRVSLRNLNFLYNKRNDDDKKLFAVKNLNFQYAYDNKSIFSYFFENKNKSISNIYNRIYDRFSNFQKKNVLHYYRINQIKDLFFGDVTKHSKNKFLIYLEEISSKNALIDDLNELNKKFNSMGIDAARVMELNDSPLKKKNKGESFNQMLYNKYDNVKEQRQIDRL